MLEEKKKEINLIGQGTYGCIYYPGIKCGKKQPKDSKNIVTKIQETNNTTNDEIEIGKIIQTIPKFNQFFAPIIERCNVNFSTIDSKAIEKCDLNLKENSKNFASNKIAYVGKYSIGKYLNKKIQEIANKKITLKKGENIVTKHKEILKKFMIKIITNHIYLLESILLLQEKNIVHFDIKENNVMYDEKNDIPIIIDFGLSIQFDKLKTVKDYKREFSYNDYETCAHWSIESILLIFICRNIILKTDKSFVSLKQAISSTTEIKKIIHTFMDDTKSDRHTGLSNEQKKRFGIKIVHYVNSFIGKTWQELWDSLLNSRNTWDNYGLVQLFYYELKKLELDSNDTAQIFIGEYSNLLKNIILAEPTKCPTITATIEQLKNIIKNIKTKETDRALKGIHTKIQDQRYVQSITKIQQKHEYDEELRDNIIDKEKNKVVNI
jgi:serine/threonine protein kinase